MRSDCSWVVPWPQFARKTRNEQVVSTGPLGFPDRVNETRGSTSRRVSARPERHRPAIALRQTEPITVPGEIAPAPARAPPAASAPSSSGCRYRCSIRRAQGVEIVAGHVEPVDPVEHHVARFARRDLRQPARGRLAGRLRATLAQGRKDVHRRVAVVVLHAARSCRPRARCRRPNRARNGLISSWTNPTSTSSASLS